MSFHQLDVRSRLQQGAPGQAASAYADCETRSYINRSPQAAQVSVVTVDTATNATLYTITIDGRVVSYTADGSATEIEIADGLAAAIDADPIAGANVSAVSDGVEDVTLTARYPGRAFTVAVSSLLSVSTTAGAAAAAVAVGAPIVWTGAALDEPELYGALADEDRFDAQVDTHVVTYEATKPLHATITVKGKTFTVSHTTASDLATSGAALAAAINEAMPAATVLAAFDTATLTLTAEQKGVPFTSAVYYGATASTGAVVSTSTAGIDTDATKAFAGIASRLDDVERATVESEDASIPGNAGMLVIERGAVWVSVSDTIAYGDDVYLDLVTNSLHNADGVDRVLLPGCTWLRGSISGDGLAVLRIR